MFTEDVAKDLVERVKADDHGTAISNVTLINRASALFMQDCFDCLNAVDIFRFISTYLKTVGKLVNTLALKYVGTPVIHKSN